MANFSSNQWGGGLSFDEDYILSRIKVSPIGCWEWQKARDPYGYGQVSRISTGESLAHRLAYRIFEGDCDGWLVLHKCDNRSCCNPKHLYLGTQASNMRDMHNRRRQRKSKLKPCELIDIHARLLLGQKQRDICAMYKISEPYMNKLKNRMLQDGQF